MSGTDPLADDGKLRAALDQAVRAMCPAWMRDDIDDIVQRGMLAAMRHRDKTERKGPLPASYLWKVAKTAMIDEMRRQRRHHQDAPLEDQDSGLTPRTDMPGPERAMESREVGIEIRRCLAALPGDRRQAVTLFLLGDRVPEVAARKGWNRKRASNLVYRGLESLRECLRQKGIES